jgi:predicted phosphoadenosine phosphosulfate sulfurtransferase
MILFLLFFIISVFAIQYIAKLLLATMKRNENPYIRFHKLKMKNETYYQEYLKWLQKKDSSGVPIEKAQSIEDYNATEKIKRLLK